MLNRRPLGRGAKQVCDWVVETGQVDCNPRSQEDDVAHEQLVLKSGPECSTLAILLSRVACLAAKHAYQHELYQDMQAA